MEARYRHSRSAYPNFFDELLLYGTCKDSCAHTKSRRESILNLFRKRLSKILELLRKSMAPRRPGTAELLYGYHILNLFVSQQARADF